MAVVHFIDEGRDVEVADGSPLKETAKEHGIVFGCEEGICGTCLCTIVEGAQNLGSPNEVELDYFGELPSDQRLICQARILSGKVKLYQ